jgi:hypothetical protein
VRGPLGRSSRPSGFEGLRGEPFADRDDLATDPPPEGLAVTIPRPMGEAIVGGLPPRLSLELVGEAEPQVRVCNHLGSSLSFGRFEVMRL